jgi:hypothetical protein
MRDKIRIKGCQDQELKLNVIPQNMLIDDATIHGPAKCPQGGD